MKTITISGLDGSGKSTQIEMLKTYLEGQGKKVFYFHAIEQGLAKKIVDFRNKYCLYCRFTGKCQVKNNEEKSVTHANWLQITLRKIFLKIDIYRFKKLRNQLRNSGFDYILSDRYFYDSVVNIEYLSKEPFRGLASKILEAKPLKPDIAAYLQTSPTAIMSRERIPDQGMEYLEKKKELYDAKTSVWNWRVIDGNQDKNVIFEEIKNYV